jgi:ribosome biogenesis GTPase
VTAAPARSPSGLGRVLHVEEGVLVVVTGGRRCTATLGPRLLARLAGTPAAGPEPGDLVELRWWPDGPVTVTRVLHRPEPSDGADVVSLRPR